MVNANFKKTNVWTKKKESLTMNYDLNLLGVSPVHAGNIAGVSAGVCDIDTVDGQGARSRRGLRQRFTEGGNLHQVVRLVRRNKL